MAEQVAVDLPGVGDIPRSLSDRPMIIRWWVHFYRFMIHKPLGGFGVVIIGLIIFAAIFAEYISPYGPDQRFEVDNPQYDPVLAEQARNDITVRLANPPELLTPTLPLNAAGSSADHWLGTDRLSRDLLTRIIYGTRLALLVGVGASVIAAVLGIFFGVISAYFGGIVDILIQRLVDSLQAFPGLILLLLFNQVISTPNKYWIMGSLGVIGVAAVIRIVRSAVIVTRNEQFVSAARTIGATDSRIMARHILPNIMAPIIVIFTISIGTYILVEATLAFIGLGDPVAISWGKMVNEGRVLGASNPWMALYVGTALTVTVLAFNLAGDGLRDALDPRLRGGGGRPGF